MMSEITVRAYAPADLPAMTAIWNQVVEDGVAFPQEELLDAETGAAFFKGQSHCGVAEEGGEVVGLYILHPNNFAASIMFRLKSWATGCCNSTPWWKTTSTPGTCTNGWDLFSWAPSPAASA